MKRLKYILLMIILIIIGCSTENKTGEIKFHIEHNLPVIYLDINGKRAKLLVDTGASYSYIHKGLIEKYKLDNLGELNTESSGIGGSKKIYDISDRTVKYKDSILQIDFKSMDLSDVRKVFRIDGIIGGDYLKENRLIIDYSKNKIYK